MTGTSVGRCGDQAPIIFRGTLAEVCALPAAHAGWHRSDRGVEWGPNQTVERFEWAYRWLDAAGNVLDEMDTRDLSWETAEERAHRLAANRPASVPGGAVVRYRVVTTEEVVATYPEVKP